ncbi:MAG: DNA polymerase III subunit delta', partial [Candidatus Sericytochromatia bacterium]|nr:DNA polymerase III subunit delta' [Candidatus Tanganyikabacteria bacterium]
MAERDEKPSIPAPRETVDLLGHAAAEAVLHEAWRSRRLPHGWLFTGPEGIGKATLAFRFARFVLADGGGEATLTGGLFGDGPPVTQSLRLAPEHPVFRRVAAGGHLDLLTLDRREKTVISVEQ